MGKDKPNVIEALKYLVDNNFEIVKVVGPLSNELVNGGKKLNQIAKELGIKTITDDELYNVIENNKQSLGKIDIVISFLFWKKIKKSLIELSNLGCINFHSAPLPEFRGVSGYSFAIFQNLNYWGVSAHMVDESFDTGKIIKVKKFDINLKDETAFSLEQRSQIELLELFKEILSKIKNENKIETYDQKNGTYYSMDEFEKLRQISNNDSLEDIERKIRAFWYPPHDGASIKLKGEEFTVINRRILEEIKDMYWKNLENNKKLEDG